MRKELASAGLMAVLLAALMPQLPPASSADSSDVTQCSDLFSGNQSEPFNAESAITIEGSEGIYEAHFDYSQSFDDDGIHTYLNPETSDGAATTFVGSETVSMVLLTRDHLFGDIVTLYHEDVSDCEILFQTADIPDDEKIVLDVSYDEIDPYSDIYQVDAVIPDEEVASEGFSKLVIAFDDGDESAVYYVIPDVSIVSEEPVSLSAFAEESPVIDGRVGPEWDDAAGTDFVTSKGKYEGTFYAFNDEDSLYIALAVGGDTLSGGFFQLYFDDNHDGLIDQGEDFLMFYPNSPSELIDMTVDTASGNSFTAGNDVTMPWGGTNDGSAAARNDDGTNYFELSHPLCSDDSANDFCLHPGDTVGFHLQYGAFSADHWPGPGFLPDNQRDASRWGDIVIAAGESVEEESDANDGTERQIVSGPPPGTKILTGQPFPDEYHNVAFSDPGPQTKTFPDPEETVWGIFATVTTYVKEAALYFVVDDTEYSVPIAPNSNTLLGFESAKEVSEIRIAIADRGYSSDQGNVAYVYSAPEEESEEPQETDELQNQEPQQQEEPPAPMEESEPQPITPPPGFPDLTPIQIYLENPDAPIGKKVTIVCKLMNQGDKSSGGFNVDFYVDGSRVKSVFVDRVPLRSQDLVEADGAWVKSAGTHEFKCAVDRTGSVTEGNENNNILITSFSFAGTTGEQSQQSSGQSSGSDPPQNEPQFDQTIQETEPEPITIPKEQLFEEVVTPHITEITISNGVLALSPTTISPDPDGVANATISFNIAGLPNDAAMISGNTAFQCIGQDGKRVMASFEFDVTIKQDGADLFGFWDNEVSMKSFKKEIIVEKSGNMCFTYLQEEDKRTDGSGPELLARLKNTQLMSDVSGTNLKTCPFNFSLLGMLPCTHSGTYQLYMIVTITLPDGVWVEKPVSGQLSTENSPVQLTVS